MSWSPAQYLTFEEDRTRPVRDLLAAIPPTNARAVIDIGCGPGNSTELLAARYPEARASGIDSSPDMIAAAQKRLPTLTFTVADIATWQDPGPYDVILGNAVLQWIPDHRTLLPALLARLTPAGSLALQMPDNLEEPAHRIMRALAADGPWAPKLAEAANQRAAREDAEAYYRILRPQCARVDVWQTTYMHVLASPDAIVEWFKGSGLRPFLQPLDPPEQTEFLHRYRTLIAAAYPPQPGGSVLLPFPRLFLIGTR